MGRSARWGQEKLPNDVRRSHWSQKELLRWGQNSFLQTRGIPARPVCPGCGHRFPPDNTRAECPTTAVVGPLILQRRRENPDALGRLTRDQWFGLVARRTSPLEHRQTYRPATDAGLFDINPTRRNGGMR